MYTQLFVLLLMDRWHHPPDSGFNKDNEVCPMVSVNTSTNYFLSHYRYWAQVTNSSVSMVSVTQIVRLRKVAVSY